MNKTKSRYPSWWAYYHLARNAYFLLGIPCLLLYSAAYTSDLLDDNLRHSTSLFILAYGCYFLLFIPPLWLYLKTRAKKKKVLQVVQ
ncbi:ethanolamine utilization protein EutE, partial [Escherichia coli]|nr:ethanolamine utilization protein EutE [Escherichia coli]